MTSFNFILASENAIKITVDNDQNSKPATSSSPAFFAAIRQHFLQQRWPWMQDALAAESSITVFYDLEIVAYRAVKKVLSGSLLDGVKSAASQEGSLLTLPVRYGGAIGEDLPYVAEQSGLSVAEVIRLHQDCVFTVTAVGFAPGFGYLKGLPKALRLPRRVSPRIAVPKGALAIAEDYTAIYPEQSPGGWHIIGHCAEPLFDVSLPKPALLEVGQKVKFIAMD